MPSWVRDHDKWEEAKSKVDRKKYPNSSDYYSVVTHVYKNLGGEVKHSSKFINLICRFFKY
jgi:hypothetical protein